MSAGKFILPDPETITMSGETARKLISCGSGDAALLYICILTSGGIFSREGAAEQIRRTPEQVDAAMAVLARLGLVRAESAAAPVPEQAEELPEYTAGDIKRELENSVVFKNLAREMQSALGRVFSSSDLMCLFGIYDHLGLPPEVILLLTNNCVAEYSVRYGDGRRPTMRYIEKAAYEWEREGIFSLDAAEEYLKRRAAAREKSAAFAGALQIKGRALTASEQRYISSWLAMGFGADAAAEAYDRTVLQTGKLSWNYMDSIMRSWHSKNIHTPAEIEKLDSRTARTPSVKAAAAKPSAGGPTADDIARNLKILERVKGGK